MAIDLTIHFAGECLYVPTPDAATPSTYVLMPVVPGMPHVAMLCVQSEYLAPPALPWSYFSMQRMQMTIGGGTSFGAAVPDDLANVGAVADSPIIPDTLTGDPRGLLDSLVTLTSGAQDGDLPGVCWRYPTATDGRATPQQLTYGVDWTVRGIESDSGTLTLSLTPLDRGPAAYSVTLLPVQVNGTDTVEVSIYHAPQGELPGENGPPVTPPNPGSAAPHFFAFYDLFVQPASRVSPTYVGVSCFGGGGSPFTCLGATAPLSPP